MQTNVIDIIVYMARKLNTGVDIHEIDEQPLQAYNKAEVGAAYSWIIQKYGISDMSGFSESWSDTNSSNYDASVPAASSDDEESDSSATMKEILGFNPYPIQDILDKLEQAHPHRVLHPAEEMILPTESYGFLLELYHIGLINQDHLERIIERIMLHHNEPVDIGKLKELIAEEVFEEDDLNNNKGKDNLTGDETIQ